MLKISDLPIYDSTTRCRHGWTQKTAKGREVCSFQHPASSKEKRGRMKGEEP